MARETSKLSIRRYRHTQLWIAMLALLAALLPFQLANATTTVHLRDDNGNQPIPDAMVNHGVVWHPLVAESSSVTGSGRSNLQGDPPEVLQASTGVTATISVTTTTTITPAAIATKPPMLPPVADSAPADDAYAAWNSRAPVTREASYPVRLQIPAIGVDAYVEQHGERADGSMATPVDPSNVAWYRAGAIPGENGNMVVAGHLDRVGGAPAVFWDLAHVKAGDSVIVQDVSGTEYHYVVTKQVSYPYNQAPLDEIFGFDLVSRLNLITCRGTWDRNRQTYSQRLVVYSDLVKIVEK